MDESAGGMMLDAAYLRVTANCYSTTGKCLAEEELTRLRALVAELTERLEETRKERDSLHAEVERLTSLWKTATTYSEHNCDVWGKALVKAEKERDEAREVLGEVVHQACKVEGAERLDSSALRTYADALRLLASWGQVRITSETGRRVIAEWVEQ